MEENFIRDFSLLFQKTEVPPLYALWTGIAGVSAALGRKVWLRNGFLTLYPNVYIVLTGPPGVGKSTALSQLETLFGSLPESLAPHIVSSEVTPARLIEELIEKNKAHPDLIFEEKSHSGFALLSEFGTFMSKGAYDGGLPSLLIDLYDGVDHKKGTRSHGSESLTKPCFGLLGCTTIDWIRSSLPQGSIGGGFVSRFIFVYVEDRPSPVPLIQIPEYGEIMERIENSIKRLCLLRGEMYLSDSAKNLYVRSYLEFHTHEFWDNPHLAGYANRRRKNHILKIAMLFAAANESMVIEERHLESARRALMMVEKSLPQVVNRITSSLSGDNAEWILKEIRTRGNRTPSGLISISRTTLFKSVVHQMNTREFNDVIDSLHSSGQISRESNGQDMYYRIKP